MPYTPPLSNADKLEKLRHGHPGAYEFHLVQGESYEAFEALMAEAKALALHHHGSWETFNGSLTRPESLSVVLNHPAAIDEDRHI